VFSDKDKPWSIGQAFMRYKIAYRPWTSRSKFPDKNWKLSSLIKFLKKCGIVQHQVYQSQVLNIDELKQYLLHVWHGIDQTTIDNITDKWHRRLWVCVCVWASGTDVYGYVCVCVWAKGGRRATIVAIFSHMTAFVKCDTTFLFFFVNYHKF